MPWHAAGDGVDGVLDVDTLGFEELGQLADGVLSLRDRKTVAGHDDHVLGIGQLDRHIVRADLTDGAVDARDRASRVVTTAEATDHDVHDRSIHGIGHQLGQDRARRTHQGPRDDEHRVAQHEPGHRRG